MAKGDSYNSAYSVLETRRLAARARHLAKQEEILSKLPQIRQINDEITETGAGHTLAILSKNTREAAALRRKMDRLIALRANILEEAGYSENDLAMQYYCPVCQDTGIVNGKACRCMKDEITRQRQQMLTLLSPAPDNSFEQFRLEFYPKKALETSSGATVVPYSQMKAIFDYCKAYAANFSLNNKSLLMLGNAGLGKTHLACSIAKVCMEKGFVVMYASAQSLFSKIEQARYTDEDVISDILECDLFILDDLGAESMTNFSLSVFYNIVNTRMINGKPCIYTTNLASQSALQKRYGEKISSRLMGSCERLFFVGDDIRILKNR
ncbi:MAG: ATP-binding protein [Oscillospiraceae bacterium]|nr:ATP-binding protein [Oscillospiraceae bacterium]